ncbi:DUF3368 domain-containing protein [Salinicoccus sp. Marseille-QA3877]
MRKIVVNSTPLIALNNIGQLDLLEKVYGEVIIPTAVYEEVILDVKTVKPNDFIRESGFITIADIRNEEAKKVFETSLHKGEVEVMILANEIKADLCIIDDLLARKYAKYHNLKVTGTIGVLLKSKQLGIVENVKTLLDELINAGMYIDTKLYSKVLEIAEEDNNS